MAFNGSGLFSRVYNWVSDRNNGIKISASRMDQELDGFAAGLSNCLTKDGQTQPTANIPMNSKKITGLAAGTADGDAIHFGQLATMETRGVVELATQEEARAALDQSKPVSPFVLRAAVSDWTYDGGTKTGAAAYTVPMFGTAVNEIDIYGLVPTLNGDTIYFRFYNGGADTLLGNGWSYAAHGRNTASADYPGNNGATNQAALMESAANTFHHSAKIIVPRPDLVVGKIVSYKANWLHSNGNLHTWDGAMRYANGAAFSHFLIFSGSGQPFTFEYVATAKRYYA